MFIGLTEREKEKESSMWDRNINQLPPLHAPTGIQTHSLGMCPDRGSNPQPWGAQDNAPTEPPSQGTILTYLKAPNDN